MGESQSGSQEGKYPPEKKIVLKVGQKVWLYNFGLVDDTEYHVIEVGRPDSEGFYHYKLADKDEVVCGTFSERDISLSRPGAVEELDEEEMAGEDISDKEQESPFKWTHHRR
ncbi:hypothetical protein ACLMJK_004533 [Lecanora helva]